MPPALARAARRLWPAALAAPLAAQPPAAASPRSSSTSSSTSASTSPTVPTFAEWIGLRTVGAPAIAPDGRTVAYTVTAADWEGNRFAQELWLARPGQAPIRLTSGGKGALAPRWSPDGRWLAFADDRGDGRQLYLLRAGGGEARRLTRVKDGVGAFEWSPAGGRLAFTAPEPEDAAMAARRRAYGEFTVETADFRRDALWTVPADTADDGRARAACARVDTLARTADSVRAGAGAAVRAATLPGCGPAERPLTAGRGLHVRDFAWSPDGRRLAVSHTPDPLLAGGDRADLAVVDAATGAVRPLVTTPGPDDSPVWSPDGRRLLFSTAGGDTAAFFYRNPRLALVDADGGPVTPLATPAFDEIPSSVVWTPAGVRFLGMQGTVQRLYALDPATGATRVLVDAPAVVRSASVTRDGRAAAFVGEDAVTLPEVYRVALDGRPGRGAARAARAARADRLTNMTAQTAGWALGTRELVSWTSADGARIEGVLYKPAGYDPRRRYPLLVVVHGGPAAVSRPVLGGGGVYPVAQFLAKSAAVLMPNYRGSAGYGERFRALNVRNLGVGDAWDVLSGVDALVARGVADSARLGVMGWSQGGYISAFLATTSTRFRAVSVGAGISDWTTYYVSTDITPFTRQYLGATPWADPAVYARTSPITYVRRARTPTLIQHGEFDRRVPIANAYELFQGLRDVGVPTRLVVYKGFGHGINKPREQLAATWHNWQWFAKYLWGEEVALPSGDPATAR
jgi:dipeptidyl aminopeptidase/acylaminoacyl peptidase